MKYTPATIAKALVAFVIGAAGAAGTASGGLDVSTLSVGQWLFVVGTGLTTAGGVFATPNKSTDPVLTPAERITQDVQQVVSDAQIAQLALNQVTGVVTGAVRAIPGVGQVLGPLAQQALSALGDNPVWHPPTAYSQPIDAAVAPWDRPSTIYR